MRILRAFLLITAASVSFAADVTDVQLVSYVRRSLASCPGSNIKLTTSGEVAPAGFVRYLAVQTSSDTRCGRKADVLVHRPSGTVLVGDIFPLPIDPRPADARIAELTTRILRKQTQVTIEPAALSDGMRRVRIITTTKYGPFAFGGYTDSGNRFLAVGRRGNLMTDPGKALLESVGASAGAHMGTRGAPITIVELSDLQCPTCKRAHDKFEPFLKKNLSKISYTRLDLPLFEGHDWTIPAALAARAMWRVAPDKYWSFVDDIFDNQETLNAGSITSFVSDWVEGNGVDTKKFDAVWKPASELKTLLEQTGRIYDNSISSTPTFVVNGQVIHYGGDGEYLLTHLSGLVAAANKAPVKKPASKPAAKPRTRKPVTKKSN